MSAALADEAQSRLADARRRGDAVSLVSTAAGTVIVIAPTAERAGGTDLVSLAAAARIAATSVRVVRDAVRVGDLTAYGRQRDRAVRRGDLEAWIETRRAKPVAGPDDAAIDSRVRRLRAARGAA